METTKNLESCNKPWGQQANCQHADGTGHCYLSVREREQTTFCDNVSESGRRLAVARARGRTRGPGRRSEMPDNKPSRQMEAHRDASQIARARRLLEDDPDLQELVWVRTQDARNAGYAEGLRAGIDRGRAEVLGLLHGNMGPRYEAVPQADAIAAHLGIPDYD